MCEPLVLTESALYVSTIKKTSWSVKKNLPEVEDLRTSPDYHFGPKLKRMFSDGPEFMAQPCLFTKQTHKATKSLVLFTVLKNYGLKQSIYFILFISDQKFQKFAIAVPEWKSKIAPEQ